MVSNPSHLAHLEGEEPYLGDLGSPWLLTTYKSWDDPPSSGPKTNLPVGGKTNLTCIHEGSNLAHGPGSFSSKDHEGRALQDFWRWKRTLKNDMLS